MIPTPRGWKTIAPIVEGYWESAPGMGVEPFCYLVWAIYTSHSLDLYVELVLLCRILTLEPFYTFFPIKSLPQKLWKDIPSKKGGWKTIGPNTRIYTPGCASNIEIISKCIYSVFVKLVVSVVIVRWLAGFVMFCAGAPWPLFATFTFRR